MGKKKKKKTELNELESVNIWWRSTAADLSQIKHGLFFVLAFQMQVRISHILL